MLKLIALIAAIVCLSHSEGTDWINWNTFASTNYTYVHAISIPSVPTGWSRHTDSSNSNRAYQYRYNKAGVLPCSLYCGPRTFLKADSNNNPICQRDQDSNFWGPFGLSDNLCIPDASGIGCGSNFVTGDCGPNSYPTGVYSGHQCCFQSGSNIDLLQRNKTTSYYALRNAEWFLLQSFTSFMYLHIKILGLKIINWVPLISIIFRISIILSSIKHMIFSHTII